MCTTQTKSTPVLISGSLWSPIKTAWCFWAPPLEMVWAGPGTLLQQAGSGFSAHLWAFAHAVPFPTIFPFSQQKPGDRNEEGRKKLSGAEEIKATYQLAASFLGVRSGIPGFGEPSPPPPLLRMSMGLSQ